MLEKRIIETDLCVIGGGISGLCAAVSAARNGINVVLMHERPVLGGNASSEIRMWVCGARGENNRETGLIEEIALENTYRNPTKNYYLWDTVLYEFALREKNLTLLLNCTCMDASVETGNFADGRDRRITSVTGYQMTTQQMIEVKSKFYADCSGDSILAPLTGAEFKMGRESADEYGEQTHVKTPDDMTMGMSCLIYGRETTEDVKFTPPSWSTKLSKEDTDNRRPDIYSSYENFWYLELGGNRNTIKDTEEITKELVPLALGMWDFVKNSGEYDSSKWDIDFLGFLPGKRESRRMMGEYIIKQTDISNDVQFEDTVAFGGWPLDDHFPAGFYHRGTANTDVPTAAPYCIPYRALYSKNVENLFFAGRNISMTHMAMSSVRVMATCGLLGQAVGTAASVATKENLTPHGVYKEKLADLQQLLNNADCFLPNIKRKVSPLCASAASDNVSPLLYNGEDRPNRVYKSETCGISVENGNSLEYKFNEPTAIKSVHVVFDSDLNRTTQNGDDCERTHSTRANVRLDSPVMIMPKTLCKEFTVEVTDETGRRICLKKETENKSRFCHIELDKPVCAIRLTPVCNWGNSDKTPVFSFDFEN